MRSRCEILFRQKPLFLQVQQIDEQRVAGKSRKTLIRRVSVAGGIQRQYLPDCLSCGGQEIDKLMSHRAKIADAVSTRQRSNVKQNSTRARKDHNESVYEQFLRKRLTPKRRRRKLEQV